MNRTGVLATRMVVVYLLLLFVGTVQADTTAPAKAPAQLNAPAASAGKPPVKTPAVSKEAVTGAQILQLVTGLVGILMLILFMAWIIRRGGKIHLNKGKGLDIVSVMPMGAREKVVLLQVGEEQILIGVSQTGGIRTLHKLENNVNPDTRTTPVPGGFQEKLKAMLGKGKADE